LISGAGPENTLRRLPLIPAILFSLPAVAQTASEQVEGCLACGTCGGGMVMLMLIPVAIIALNIALLVWVAKDARARGMDNSALWMVVVMFTSVMGLVIYILSRPQGNLVPCPHCGNKRLVASAQCPHCGNP
jgi:hypothetical protein